MQQELVEKNNSIDSNSVHIRFSRKQLLCSIVIFIVCGLLATFFTKSRSQVLQYNQVTVAILVVLSTGQMITFLILFCFREERQNYFLILRKTKSAAVDLVLIWATFLLYFQYFPNLKDAEFGSGEYNEDFWIFNLLLIQVPQVIGSTVIIHITTDLMNRQTINKCKEMLNLIHNY